MAASPHVKCRMTGDGRVTLGVDLVSELQETEMFGVNRLAPAQPRNDLRPGDRDLPAFVIDEIGDGLFLANFYAADPADEEIGVEILAAEFSVGDGFQAKCFLLSDDAADGSVLGCVKVFSGHLSYGMLPAEPLQFRGAQQAAHMVSPKRWVVRSRDRQLDTPLLHCARRSPPRRLLPLA